MHWILEGGYFSPLPQRNLSSRTCRCSPIPAMPLYEARSSFFLILGKRNKGKMAVSIGWRENWGTMAALTLSRVLWPREERICKMQQLALKTQHPHCVLHVFTLAWLWSGTVHWTPVGDGHVLDAAELHPKGNPFAHAKNTPRHTSAVKWRWSEFYFKSALLVQTKTPAQLPTEGTAGLHLRSAEGWTEPQSHKSSQIPENPAFLSTAVLCTSTTFWQVCNSDRKISFELKSVSKVSAVNILEKY